MKPDLNLTVDNETVTFEFDTAKKEEIAETLIQFFKENKGIANYFSACLAASFEKGLFK